MATEKSAIPQEIYQIKATLLGTIPPSEEFFYTAQHQFQKNTAALVT